MINQEGWGGVPKIWAHLLIKLLESLVCVLHPMGP